MLFELWKISFCHEMKDSTSEQENTFTTHDIWYRNAMSLLLIHVWINCFNQTYHKYALGTSIYLVWNYNYYFPGGRVVWFLPRLSKFQLDNSTIIKWASILVQDTFSKFSQNLTNIHMNRPPKYNYMWLLADLPSLLG